MARVLKEGWEVKKLGEVCKIVGGGTPSKKKEEYYNGNILWATVRDMKVETITDTEHKITQDAIKNSSTNIIPKDNIIIATRVGLGKVCKLQYDTAINQDLKGIIPLDSKKISIEFLFRWFTSISEKIISEGTGATVQGVKLTFINSLSIFIPPLQEQERIVAILDEAFGAIEKAKANAQLNLKNAKELFESYLQSIFKNKGDDWEEKKWGELCHFVRGPFGGSLKKSMFKDEGYVVYEQKHAIHDHFNQIRYFIDEDKFTEMKRFEVKPNDIIMSCSGSIGKVAIIPENIPRGIINQALLKLTPNKGVFVHFIKHWLRSKIFQDIIFEHSGGAAIPNVPSAKIMKEILIPFPKFEEQEKIVEKIEAILSQTKKLESIYEQKLQDLDELKKSILQKAFNGEL
ncbi:restriction endonuclease subunit S [Sulfurimonas sp.]|uniref:restriction endonuclease subunit S n=1 Tax=Sulfurimonas sp. TaxID=2022749 RepID=UPI0025F8B7B7|nr:restriction endonuclease subunit S [Sulfurimonas sp.]